MNKSDRLTSAHKDLQELTNSDEVETTTIRTRHGRDHVTGINQDLARLLLRDDVAILSIALNSETDGDRVVMHAYKKATQQVLSLQTIEPNIDSSQCLFSPFFAKNYSEHSQHPLQTRQIHTFGRFLKQKNT